MSDVKPASNNDLFEKNTHLSCGLSVICRLLNLKTKPRDLKVNAA